jgi:ATP-dependent helicase/nuclease subunit A
VLNSYIGGFTQEEIAKIRIISPKKRRLIDSLYLYVLKGDDPALKEKITSLTDELDEFRRKAMYMSASDIIREIYEKYEYTVMVSSLPGGEQRFANVKLLAETADEYEEQGIFCIHDFVKYIEKLKARQDMGEANMLDENANVVKIMTIHKSKGLEYPVCFVAGLNSQFLSNGGKVLVDKVFGLGGDTFNLETRVRGISPVKRAISVKENIESVGEEIRVLYVALTRAREKLFMTGMLDKDLQAKDDLSFVDIMKAGSFMNLVYPLVKEKKDLFIVEKIVPEDFEISAVLQETEREVKKNGLKLIEGISGFEEFKYPHDTLDGLFVKTTVYELKKAAYLEREDGENTLYHEEEKRVPKIIAESETGNGGAARGSAYHRVMELMDFANIYNGDVVSNLREHRKKMVDDLFIYEEDDALVSEKKVLDFLDTDLSKRMSEAAKKDMLYLEQPFVLSVNAHTVREEFPESEKILVQGVIDVYFEEDGKLVLMDYKTDRVDSGEELINRYKTQLDYYAEALSRLEKKPVAEILIYSFALSKVIRV